MMQEARENYVVLLLGAEDGPVPSMLHLQQEMFVVSQAVPKAAELFEFEPSRMGPSSQLLESTFQRSLDHALVHMNQNVQVTLTTKGRNAYEQITVKYKDNSRFSELLGVLGLVRILHDRLESDELLFLTYRTHPDYVETPGMGGRFKNGEQLADSLLSKGLITAGRHEDLVWIERGEHVKKGLKEIIRALNQVRRILVKPKDLEYLKTNLLEKLSGSMEQTELNSLMGLFRDIDKIEERFVAQIKNLEQIEIRTVALVDGPKQNRHLDKFKNLLGETIDSSQQIIELIAKMAQTWEQTEKQSSRALEILKHTRAKKQSKKHLISMIENMREGGQQLAYDGQEQVKAGMEDCRQIAMAIRAK